MAAPAASAPRSLGSPPDRIRRVHFDGRFAERARTELDATGAYVGRRESNDAATLTSQESRIAELVAEGTSNPEIAATVFVSRRTVESHLTKIYAKLGITSRTQLAYKILHNQDVPR